MQARSRFACNRRLATPRLLMKLNGEEELHANQPLNAALYRVVSGGSLPAPRRAAAPLDVPHPALQGLETMP